MKPSRRRVQLGVAVVGMILVLVAVALRRRAPESHLQSVVKVAERRGSALAAAAAARRAGHGSPQATSLPSAPATPTAGLVPATAPAQPVPAHIGPAAAAEYRRRARYPRSSVPIDDGQDPILRDREVSPRIVRGPNGREPSLVVFPDQVSFERPDPIVLYAYLSLDGVPVPAQGISGEILDPQGGSIARLLYRDDGGDGDPQGGDAVYTARVKLDDTPDRRLKGSYLVRVHAVTTDGEERFGSTGFLYSNPDAQLTGSYTDAVVNGSLEIQAQVEVAATGRFHIEATLYTPAGRPLVWAQNATQLSPGTHWLPLSFYGLALREQGVDGPYLLRFVALTTATEMPNAKNRLVEDAYVTGAYPVTSFSDQPFNDPDLLDAAERLEAAAGAVP